jgi:hypothetical protein
MNKYPDNNDHQMVIANNQNFDAHESVTKNFRENLSYM